MGKRMLRWGAAALALTLCVVLAACGDAEDHTADFAGVWEIESTTASEGSASAEDVQLLQSLGLDVFLVLDEGGSGMLDAFGSTSSLTWTASSASAARIEVASGDYAGAQTLSLADGRLVMAADGQGSVSFVRSTQERRDEVRALGGDLAALLAGTGGNQTPTEAQPSEPSEPSEPATDFAALGLTEGYSSNEHGYSFLVPAGAHEDTEAEAQNSTDFVLLWDDPHLIVKAYRGGEASQVPPWVDADVADMSSVSMEELAGYFAAHYDAQTIEVGQDYFIALSTASSGKSNYTLYVRADYGYYLDIYLYPEDDTGLLHDQVMAMMESFGIQA